MGHCSAALRSYDREGLDSKGHPFSRSYGVNLPSSLTTVLPSALGYSPHPPVSVLVRTPESLPRGFSRRSVQSLRQKRLDITSGFTPADLPTDHPRAYTCI